MPDGTAPAAFASNRVDKDPINGTYPSEYDLPVTGTGTGASEEKYEFYVTANNKHGPSEEKPRYVKAFLGKQGKPFLYYVSLLKY